MRESKEYLKKIDHHKEILQKADAFPDNLNNEVLKLRAQFLKYENDAACSEERLYNLEYKLSGCVFIYHYRNSNNQINLSLTIKIKPRGR